MRVSGRIGRVIQRTALAALLLAFIILLARGKNEEGAKSAAPAAQPPASEKRDSSRNFNESLGGGMTLRMIGIKGGTFEMGAHMSVQEMAKRFPNLDGAHFTNALPLHAVALSGFWLGETHVTVGQFRRFTDETAYRTEGEIAGACSAFKDGKIEAFPGYSWRNPGFTQTDSYPVLDVSWNDAKAFCDWLSKKSGKAYQLPTEAQYEYACRAGTKTLFQWGDNPDGGAGWLNGCDQSAKRQFPDMKYVFRWDDGYVFTSPVKNFRPNAWGLYDMHGNVWSWCADWYGQGYYAEKGNDRNPAGPTSGTVRVLRGGSWGTYPQNCMSSYRYTSPQWDKYVSAGFRICLPSATK
ncbi:MAG: formylglycine-generating enzyme family protein [Candidatus Sumerlaeota bacterium]|nr:formylglycine-generating enzyme family protein [Candidatus Sumerlaeota bacterium]